MPSSRLSVAARVPSAARTVPVCTSCTLQGCSSCWGRQCLWPVRAASRAGGAARHASFYANAPPQLAIQCAPQVIGTARPNLSWRVVRPGVARRGGLGKALAAAVFLVAKMDVVAAAWGSWASKIRCVTKFGHSAPHSGDPTRRQQSPADPHQQPTPTTNPIRAASPTVPWACQPPPNACPRLHAMIPRQPRGRR